VLVALLAIALGVFVAVKDNVTASPATTAAPATAAPPPPATAAAPAASATTTSAAAPAGSGSSKGAAKPAGVRTKRVALASAIGMNPWWTQADVLEAARPHDGEIQACVDAAAQDYPKLATSVDVIVHAKKDGTVEDTQCSLRDHSDAEAGLCSCVAGSIGRWKLPPARGRLGALEDGNFIVEYKITSIKP
jgi:hypothetical protein